MVVNDTKMYRKMEKKGLLSIEKNIMKWENRIIVVIRNFILKSTGLENSFDEK